MGALRHPCLPHSATEGWPEAGPKWAGSAGPGERLEDLTDDYLHLHTLPQVYKILLIPQVEPAVLWGTVECQPGAERNTVEQRVSPGHR